MTPNSEPATVDLGDVVSALKRGWWIIAVCLVLGLGAAAGVLMYAHPVWTARASVLVRDANPLPSALTQTIGGSGAAAGAASALLGGALKSSVETDMALLKSRELIGEVVDSLELQVFVSRPHGTPPRRAVRALHVATPFQPVKLDIEASANGLHVTGKDIDTIVARGGSVRVPAGTVELADSIPLPARVRVYDREDAITRIGKRVDVSRSGGELIGLAWPADDSLSAPAAANLLISRFLTRRLGVDRSVNQKRLEFVGKQVDSTDRALNAALAKQRAFHEKAQTVDPSVSAKTYLESLIRLREQRELLVMEETALSHLQDQLRAHTVQPRYLAAYPAFLRSPAINELLTKIGALEAERLSLSAKQYRDEDPSVVAVRGSIAHLEAELEPLARTYGEAIGQQRSSLDTEIGLINERLARLPNQVEEAFQNTKDVERLAKTSLALNAQRVELRLATVGEGGEARQQDVAYAQWKRSFPSTLLTVFAGAFAGLALGFALAVLRSPARPVHASTLAD